MIVEIYGYAILGLVFIGLFVEREVYNARVQKEKDRLLEEISKLVKALISKNANDYVMTASIDKVPSENKPVEDPGLIDPDSLSDDEFDTALGIKRTKPK